MDRGIKYFDTIIIGSGAGGATLAKELTDQGQDILIIEKGKNYSSFGTFEDLVQYHDASGVTKPSRYSEEGVMLLRTYMAGGSTVVSCSNGMRSLEKELAEMGICIEEELSEAESELGISPVPADFLSSASRAIRSAAEELGYSMELMPKFIDQARCSNCGNCFAGCQHGAKWTALDYLEMAKQHGANVLNDTAVHKILIKNGSVKGVLAGSNGESLEILADRVILSAGGLATPLILFRSGISNCGTGLFCDTFVNIYGVTPALSQMQEIPMALVNHEFYKDKGFILSTFINPINISRFAELGHKSLAVPVDNLIGLMVKIRDERSGYVQPDGKITKPITLKDQEKFQQGISMAKRILARTGADDHAFMISKYQGAHPGGTAAIGEVVDRDLQTKIENLYVCDGSVLPVAPGLPPILTIIALAKRLAKTVS